MLIEKLTAPQYLQVALDVALRISRGDLAEGQKIYGRSIMAAEYGVSPETIRRAMRLLADVDVVTVLQQSGYIVASKQKAEQYVERFGSNTNLKHLKAVLDELLQQHQALSLKIAETARSIAKIEERTSDIAPFQNYEIVVPPDSPVIGSSLAELCFWQQTGATVIAIRHNEQIILSPGPYAQLHQDDAVILIGPMSAIEAAHNYITGSK